MTEQPMIYAAVFGNIGGALAALDSFERLHRHARDGRYDGAVIDNDGGTPRIAKRVDSPTMPAVPELLKGGRLVEHPLHDAAEQLTGFEAAFVVVGDPELEKPFDQAVTRATMTVKRPIDRVTEAVVL
jgi:hypothetical protein